jgi:hypothetical protein
VRNLPFIHSFIHAEDDPMPDFCDAGAMAQTLREALDAKSLSARRSALLCVAAVAVGHWPERYR